MWVETINIFFLIYVLLIKKNRKAKWSSTIESLSRLRKKCDAGKANIDDLKVTIHLLHLHSNEQNITSDYNWELCWTALQHGMSWDNH